MDDARPLLTRLRAENVRSFARLDLELGPLTVLVGPNGAGKSNVVSFLRLARDVALENDQIAIAKQRGLDFVVRKGHKTFSLVACVDSGIDAINLTLNQSTINQPSYGPYDSKWSVVKNGSNPNNGTPIRASYFLENQRIMKEGLKYWLSRLIICQPEPLALRDMVQREDKGGSLREDFGNLGAVLLAIRETLFGDEMDRALALLVDGVTAYRVLQAGSTLVPQILYGPDDARDLGLESDGTIRLVALLAAIYQPVPPSILVLEEPEMGLHPGVLPALAEFITEASTRMQVLVTTHSPDLIDCFDLDVIRVVEKVDGESRIGPVRPQQREAVRKHLFRPSEIMRMEGLQLDLG